MSQKPFTLSQKNSEILLQFAGETKSVPVKIAWVRPLSGMHKEISFLDEKKEEIAFMQSLDALDVESRKIAQEELEKRYLVPKIIKVTEAKTEMAGLYIYVETELGPRVFTLREPEKNIVWVTDDHVVIRDTIGNRYEIESISALDQKSRLEIEKVI